VKKLGCQPVPAGQPNWIVAGGIRFITMNQSTVQHYWKNVRPILAD